MVGLEVLAMVLFLSLNGAEGDGPIDFWPSPRAGGECANRGRSGGRGITRPALERSGRKAGDTAPIAKRARGTRGGRSSPCTEGGSAPFDPRASFARPIRSEEPTSELPTTM